MSGTCPVDTTIKPGMPEEVIMITNLFRGQSNLKPWLFERYLFNWADFVHDFTILRNVEALHPAKSKKKIQRIFLYFSQNRLHTLIQNLNGVPFLSVLHCHESVTQDRLGLGKNTRRPTFSVQLDVAHPFLFTRWCFFVLWYNCLL